MAPRSGPPVLRAHAAAVTAPTPARFTAVAMPTAGTGIAALAAGADGIAPGLRPRRLDGLRPQGGHRSQSDH
jgi:hypothetical protein